MCLRFQRWTDDVEQEGEREKIRLSHSRSRPRSFSFAWLLSVYQACLFVIDTLFFLFFLPICCSSADEIFLSAGNNTDEMKAKLLPRRCISPNALLLLLLFLLELFRRKSLFYLLCYLFCHHSCVRNCSHRFVLFRRCSVMTISRDVEREREEFSDVRTLVRWQWHFHASLDFASSLRKTSYESLRKRRRRNVRETKNNWLWRRELW